MQEDNASGPFSLGTLLAEGYLAPRRSMARVLSMRLDEGERLLMVGIGIAISLFGVALTGGQAEEAVPGSTVMRYVVSILGGLFQYYLIAWIVGLVCRATGGGGDTEGDRSLVAWWALVTAPLTVVMVVAMQNVESPFAAFVMVAAAIASFVLLAAYIAETHGYESTARVCGAMVALMMLIGFVMSSLMPLSA